MAAYAIVLHEPNPDVWDRVKQFWPEHHYIVNDMLAFIAGDPSLTLTADVSAKIGFDQQHNILGVVLQISHYYGFHSNALWEWMAKHT